MKIIQLRLKSGGEGPWVDDVRSGDYARNNKKLRLTKGVHVVIDQSKFRLG